MFQVMIVDDEESVREGIAIAVPWDELDVEYVHKAASGFEALELLKQHAIDIVITDIRMPGMSGLELIQAIQNNWKGIKCIILSGHAEFQYAQEAIRSQTTDYLLKPVLTEELAETVRNVQQKLKSEWEHISSYRQAMDTLSEHRPLLSGNMLHDLLQGRYMSHDDLYKKLQLFAVPFSEGDEIALMILRLEDEFPGYDTRSMHLLEYAVCNITEEIYSRYFRLWHSKDEHDFLVFAIKLKENGMEDLFSGEEPLEAGRKRLVERLADQLQKNVQSYLKGRISLMLSKWGRFPTDIRTLYELSISIMRRRIGSDSNFFFTMEDEPDECRMNSLDHLYRIPTLQHLLEAGRWSDAEIKLQNVFDELRANFGDSVEHVLEAACAIYSIYSHMAHQNSRSLTSLTQEDFPLSGRGEGMRSVGQLQSWSSRVLKILRDDLASNTSNMRKTILEKVREYAESHLAEDVSLVTIAEQVHLHPVYLSRVFKLETGYTLSEYLHRLKMDRASHLLKHSDARIYEIARQVGYENTYFMKVFKKHFNLTPQEYRDQ